MAADPRDLTTVAAVEAYLSLQSSAALDAKIQSLVTAASVMFLGKVGYDSMSQVADYDEFYDGNGSQRLFLRNQPIASVASLRINGVSIAPSTGYGSVGFAVDQSKKSIFLRNGGGGGSFTAVGFPAFGCGFAKGIQNVEVSYSAGYDSVPADVDDKIAQLVAINYKRAGWVDQAMQQLQQAGTIRYRDWAYPPEFERCILDYRRVAVV